MKANLEDKLTVSAQSWSYQNYKHPMVIGTKQEIENFIQIFINYQNIYDVHNICWKVLDNNADKILGEYEWPSN